MASGITLNSGRSIVGTLPLVLGGTGSDLSATGGSGQVVKQITAGAALSVGLIDGTSFVNSPLTFNVTDSIDSVDYVVSLSHTATDPSIIASGFGVGIQFLVETSGAAVPQQIAGAIAAQWTTSTQGSQVSKLVLSSANSSGLVSGLTIAPTVISSPVLFDVAATVRATGNTSPASGVGVEISYTGTIGVIQVYDRGGTVYKPAEIEGSTLSLNTTTNGAISTGTGAFNVFGQSSIGINNTTSVPTNQGNGGLGVSWNRSAGGGELNLYNLGTTGSVKGFVVSQMTGPGTFTDIFKVDGTGITTIVADLKHAGTKVGLFNVTPIAQPSAVGTATGYTAGTTAATFHSDDTYSGNTGTTKYTINGIVAALKNLGVIAT